MSIFGGASNYPPGESGRAVAGEAEFRCNNEACPNYRCTWTASGHSELGGFFLDRDEDADCPECGEEGVQD